jgi:hypothetical protein
VVQHDEREINKDQKEAEAQRDERGEQLTRPYEKWKE